MRMVRVEYQASYRQDADFVWKALTDEAFLAAYAKEIGALRSAVAISRTAEYTRTRVEMTVPTTGVPAAFKRFVTPTVDIVEERTWGSGDERFQGSASVDAAVGKRAARIRGGLALVPLAEGCHFTFAGDISVNLPLVGNAAAGLIRDLIRKVLSQQTKVLLDWPGS
jgi:hypothetical protein